MTDYRAQLAQAVNAVHIYSPTRFSWFGKRSPRLLPRIEREITPRTARNYLHYTLQSCLYTNFYCHGAALPSRDYQFAGSPDGAHSFVERLSEANCGHGYWEAGWELVELPTPGGLAAARRDGLLVLAGETDYKRGDPASGNSEAEKSLWLRFSKELPAISPGFYMAVGDQDLYGIPANDRTGTGDVQAESSHGNRIVRLYWHVTPEGAVALMRLVTRALNQAGIPFRLKVLNDPDCYDRCDAGVLYIRRADYSQSEALIAPLYEQLRPQLSELTPALTDYLAPGLGLAEDPGDGDSFGLHRCGLIADALIRAYENGVQHASSLVEAVTTRFAEEGISLQHPYLGPGSQDNYTFSSSAISVAGAPAIRNPQSASPIHLSDEVEQPHTRIAHQLVREAIWHEDRCNWLGTEVLIEREKHGGAANGLNTGLRREEWRSLGPDLYTGTAGVALFLAEYAAVTGDSAAHDTALGAIRHAFHHCEAIPPSDRLGLYTGWMGIALAGARLGLLFGDGELSQRALALARQCSEDAHPAHENDLLAGSAGAIVALVALAEMLGAPILLDYAARFGDDLLAAAHEGRDGESLTWSSPAVRSNVPLTGFSHGAAGIAYALLELWRVTGDVRYKNGAWAAFQYEAGCFNPQKGNWPDFREITPAQLRQSPGTIPYATFWCHGAPGIALSRLHAYHLTHDATRRSEALAALSSTVQSMQHDLGSGGGNFSLCHGLAGNADVLLHGITVVEAASEKQVFSALIKSVAGEGVRRRDVHGRWSLGLGGRPTAQSPGLMLGLAGTGHFYLRLVHPTVPSVLLIRPKDWATPNP